MRKCSPLPVLACAILFRALPGLLGAESAPPFIRLTNPATPSWETEDFSITLQGSVDTERGLSNVLWVNQSGHRGTGIWTETGQGKANWTVADILLRPGTNLITVVVVDAANHSASLHIAVNRRPAPGTQPQALEVRTGTWRNHPIAYQIWNGRAVVEGDIIIGSLPVNPASGEGAVPEGLAIDYTSELWPVVNGVHQVPYIITGSNANLTTAINAFNQHFPTVIQFVARSSQTNYVDIVVENTGSGEGFSSVGMVGREQTLTCGGGCSIATWLHEMGHTVGLQHESQRPDRTNFLALNLSNADLPNVPNNFTLIPFDSQTIGLYDYASVMHYGAFEFSKAGLPVLESIPAGIPLGNDTGYSAGDIDQIERLYGAIPTAVTVTTNPVGLQVVVDGTTYTAPQTFNWMLNSTHTLNVPAGGQATSPNDGSTYTFGNWNDRGGISHTITAQPGSGTLAAPTNKPAVTMYEANFVRLQPFAFLSPAVYPAGAGTVSVTPSPTSEFGGTFFVDRTLVTLALSPTQGSGYNFYDWFNLPYPPSDNPHTFYIQAPTTQAQAVFVSTPVTIIGESITGPHTWNPGLAASVDGGFAYLPTAFSSYYNGSGWNGGTTHSISIEQAQSPVTTNVFYNWNAWSDGGAISHNITQPNSGTQTVSASVTPFYASYTVPPPLGNKYAGCSGGVATSPAGTAYAANPAFPFYEDGASVGSTATANPAYPGMLFAGWSGSLSGNTNPQTTTIHDQFVPTASFNVTSVPITISSLAPSNAPAGSGALDITINGAGFTASSTYVYWNGSYRANTFISSTQIIMHLNAGDLADLGGQDVFAGNYVTNSSHATCGVGAEASFTVTATVLQPPAVNSLSPNSGSGLTQSFAMQFSDPNGVAEFNQVRFMFNTRVTPGGGCYVYYIPSSNALLLENDGGTGTLSPAVTPGSSQQVSNSQCTVKGSGSSVSQSGNNLTLDVALGFSGSFAGLKNVYLFALGKSGLSSGWVQKGTWMPASAGPPAVVSLSPSSGTGLTQTFSAQFTDPNGLADFDQVRIMFNTRVTSAADCYLYYIPSSNTLLLENDAGTGTLSPPVTPGTSQEVSNGQCTVKGSGSSVSQSGNNLTVSVALTFSDSFTGPKNVYLFALAKTNAASGWILKGAWTP